MSPQHESSRDDATGRPHEVANAYVRVDGSLREAELSSGLLIGAAVRPAQLSEPAHASAPAREFDLFEPEDALKWEVVHPELQSFDFFLKRTRL